MLPPEILVVWLGETPARRQRCRAKLYKGRYYVDHPTPVASLNELEMKPGTLVAFNTPIGFSRAYSEATGIPSFRAGLEIFGTGSFQWFYDIASIPEQVSSYRPFYPMKLGDAAVALRECEQKGNAAPLFWLVGPRQKGRQALALWEMLGKRVEGVSFWPFDGTIELLVPQDKPVVAEFDFTVLQQLMGMDVLAQRGAGARVAAGMQTFERVNDVDFQAVRKTLLNGYGPSAAGEEEFDTLYATIILAHLFTSGRITEAPEGARDTEGWVLGL
jgi:hypothetical protein